MSDAPGHLVLAVDDDRDMLALIERLLRGSGFEVETASSAREAAEKLKERLPDAILLDAKMAEIDGYQFCAALRKHKATARIPVIFASAAGSEEDKARAAKAGAAAYLVKPFRREELVGVLRSHIQAATKPKPRGSKQLRAASHTPDFAGFKQFLAEKFQPHPQAKEVIENLDVNNLYEAAEAIGLSKADLAKLAAEFAGLEYVSFVDPANVDLESVSSAFCKTNYVLPLKDKNGLSGFIVSNPFDLDLLGALQAQSNLRSPAVGVCEPDTIASLIEAVEHHHEAEEAEEEQSSIKIGKETDVPESAAEENSVVYLTNQILTSAVHDRATDIHLEPKGDEVAVRFRVDGEVRDAATLRMERGLGVISRLKALANLDIAEKRKPQDGAVHVSMEGREFQLRLSTAPTPDGESLSIRLLEPGAKPKTLTELGMTPDQAKTLLRHAERTQGLILVVGPTGSGKTTTVYSLLSQIDCRTKRLITIEDPVEYRIPFANQQQVNEKAGVTFDALLKASVRQDPDILFMGEIRDSYSARIAIDFASTGHLAIATLHTTDATTAIFRLERLEASRAQIAEALVAVSAQRLIRKLCPNCKQLKPITKEEAAILEPFIDPVPAEVAHPRGCDECGGLGYYGREVVCEIIEFTPEIADMVRNNVSVPDIRRYIKDHGGYLIANHAASKVRDLICSVQDAYERVLVEEIHAPEDSEGPTKMAVPPSKPAAAEPAQAETAPPPQPDAPKRKRILVVEDNRDSRRLLTQLLTKAGYEVVAAQDGIDALMLLGKKRFDLILSDVNMPNLDGFKLIEMKAKKGIPTPVVFLSARSGEDDEATGLKLGAVDYITKPVRKDILLMKVERALRTSDAS